MIQFPNDVPPMSNDVQECPIYFLNVQVPSKIPKTQPQFPFTPLTQQLLHHPGQWVCQRDTLPLSNLQYNQGGDTCRQRDGPGSPS